MKKIMVCILALTVLCAVLLTGCGETAGDGNNTTGTAGNGNNGAASPTDNVPETMLPDVNDGIVDDTDGIIDDFDTGRADNGTTGGTVGGNTTAGGASANGNAVAGTAANVRSNGMTVGTRIPAYR